MGQDSASASRLLLSLFVGIAAAYFWPASHEQKLLVGIAAALLSHLPVDLRRRRKLRDLRKWATGGMRDDLKAVTLFSATPDSVDLLAQSLGAARQQLRETEKGLIWERDRLEAVLGAMVEAVLVIDLSGVVVRSNQHVPGLLALPDEFNPVGMPIWDLSRDNELHRIVREAMDGGQSASGEFDLIGEESRRLGLTVGPTADRSAWVLVFHDMTEQRRLEQVRTDFVANVSHELQTPLTAIKGFAETLLASDLSDPVAVRRYLEIINRNSERVGLLIRDLLVISDLELGRIPLQLEPIQLSPVLDEVVELLEGTARAREVTVDLNPGTQDWVVGDHDRLVQVFLNLIDNAIKYTPSGGAVRVDWAGEGQNQLCIRVIDTGIGIPEVELPRLAERFYRVDKARSREAGGTGLGLSIVRHIVLAHNGSLEFSSRVGVGTEVMVALPVPAVPGDASSP